MAESAKHSPKVDPLKHFPGRQDTPPKKILFLGDASIGKTTFIQKYCEYVVDYYRCHGYKDCRLVLTQFIVNHHENEKRFAIRLLDLPSGSTEESRQDQYPDEVDLIVLCFAIDNPTSLANVWKTWLPESRKKYPDFSRFYLLGLRNGTRWMMLNENKMPVTLENGYQIHQKYKFLGDYMECSVEEHPPQAFDVMKTVISDVVRCEPPAVAV